uniref:isopentenyl-diphosphate Delta-isomerase n=1 Tax=Mentha piperita TaxID=34256 RepID=F2YJJ1_MENPI|nr:isopentenyl pyrophosphate:dimethylallyl pyrophosphate isomerase [Mentha x piperita]
MSSSSALMMSMSSNTTLTRLQNQNLVPRSFSSSGLPPKSLLFHKYPAAPSSALPLRRVYSSTMGMAHPDSAMDAVQRRLMFEDECILVDENDRVVGHDTKYNCHLMEKIDSENLLHRAFSVFLFNSDYELLLQQRSATKVTFPLVWTNTCCSHPLYREDELIEEDALGVRNAAQRKLFDELGILAHHLPLNEFTPLGRILYKAPSDGKWGEHELDYLLFIIRDVELHPNPDEVADVRYVNREELKELLRKADAGEGGLKLSPWFRLVVDNFLFKWWDHVEKGTLNQAADMKTIHKLTW